MLVSLLSYLSVSAGSAKVLIWWVSLVTVRKVSPRAFARKLTSSHRPVNSYDSASLLPSSAHTNRTDELAHYAHHLWVLCVLIRPLLTLYAGYRFTAGLKAQGLDKQPGFLPFKSKILPWAFWPAFFACVIGTSPVSLLLPCSLPDGLLTVLCISGWYVFLPGGFAPDVFVRTINNHKLAVS